MLTAPSPAFDAAVTADVRHLDAAVTLDGHNVSDITTKIVVDSAITTDLPAGTTLAAGSRSASATITFEGAGDDNVSALDLLHPLSTHGEALGDITGRLTTVAIGFEGERLPQFTGNARKTTFRESSAASTVTLTDASALLGDTVTLPGFGSLQPKIENQSKRSCRLRGYTNAFTSLPTNTAGIATWVLHTAGLRVTPIAPNAFLSVPAVGGYLADVGRLRSINLTQFSSLQPNAGVFSAIGGTVGRSMWTDGPYGPVMKTSRIASGSGALDTVFCAELDQHPNVGVGRPPLRVEGYAYFPESGASNWASRHTMTRVFIANGAGYQLSLAGAQLTVDSFAAGSATLTSVATSTAVTPGWHWFRVDISAPTSTTATAVFLVDGADAGSGTGTADGSVRAVREAHFGCSVAMQAFSASVTTAVRSLPSTFIPDAYVETGDVNVDRVTGLTGVQWDLLSDLAEAELGAALFDTDGKFRLLSGTTVRGATSVRTLGRDLIGDLSGFRAWDAIRNTFTADRSAIGWDFAWNSGGTADNPSAPTSVFGLNGATVVDGTYVNPRDILARVYFPTGTTTLELSGSDAICVDLGSFRLWQNALDAVDYPGLYLTASATEISPHPAGPGNVTVSARQTSTTTVEVTVVNNSGAELYCRWPPGWQTDLGYSTGGDALGVYAFVPCEEQAYTQRVVVADAASIETYGPQPLTTTNPFLTDLYVTQLWATTVVNDLKDGTLIFDTFTAPGDPRVVVGDVLTVAGTDRYDPVDVRVVRITRTLSTSGLTDEYTVRAL